MSSGCPGQGPERGGGNEVRVSRPAGALFYRESRTLPDRVRMRCSGEVGREQRFGRLAKRPCLRSQAAASGRSRTGSVRVRDRCGSATGLAFTDA
jgi:hypothetical protein